MTLNTHHIIVKNSVHYCMNQLLCLKQIDKMIRNICKDDFESVAQIYNHYILNCTCTFEVRLLNFC